MWVIVLILVNVILNTVDARYIKLVHKVKAKEGASKEDQEFARSEKRQQITGELEVGGQKFESLGCWRDAWSRSLPTLEGEHYLLMDPNYKGRRHALFKCARAALDKGYKLFGIENGGQCFASAGGDKRYHKYGASKDCKGDGKGGPWSLQVYRFLDSRDAVNGAYSHWSSWGLCSRTCAGGVRRRMRKCSNPPPWNGGQDCASLGSSSESQDCNVKSCTDEHEFEDHEIAGLSPTSAKRDESQIQPSPVSRPRGRPFRPIIELNDDKDPDYHTLREGLRHVDGPKQQTYLTNNGDDSHNDEVKYSPVSPTTHTQDLGQAVSQKQHSIQSNVHQSSMEDASYAFTPSEQDVGPRVNLKQHPLIEKSVHQSNKGGGNFFPMSKQDVKDFKQVASFQNSKSPSSRGQDSEDAKGVSSQMDSYDNALKQPILSPEQLKESKGQANTRPDKFTPKDNEVSKPSFQDSERFKQENRISNSSSVHQETHSTHDNEINSGAQAPQIFNTKGHSNYENIGDGGNYKPDKNVGETFIHNDGRIDAGTMELIPSDRIHGKMDNVNNKQDQNGFSLVGESLRVIKPGYSQKMSTDVASQEQNTPQQPSNNFPSRLSQNQGIEIRIRPVGDYSPKQFRTFQSIENNSDDMISAEHKSAEMPKQNLHNVDHDLPNLRNKGEETSSSTLKVPTKSNAREQESSHEQQSLQDIMKLPAKSGENEQGSSHEQESLQDTLKIPAKAEDNEQESSDEQESSQDTLKIPTKSGDEEQESSHEQQSSQGTLKIPTKSGDDEHESSHEQQSSQDILKIPTKSGDEEQESSHEQQSSQDILKIPAKSGDDEQESSHEQQSSQNTLKIPAKSGDDEQELSREQQSFQKAKGRRPTVPESQKDESENGERGKSFNSQHEKLSASNSSPDTTSQLQPSPQHKQPTSNEKQDFEQNTGAQSATFSQLQAPASHHGVNVHNSNHFSSKGNALSLSKEKDAESHSPINDKAHPSKEADSSSTVKVNQAQQVFVSNKAKPSGEETKVHPTSGGVKNENKESDQGQQSQEEGEPVPVVDLNSTGKPADETDYGATTNQVFSGPSEDTGIQNQPEPDSQGASQPSGPDYDNEAIQGLSEMSQGMDQSILQQANSASQGGPDQGIGTGYDEMSDSNAYTGEKSKQDAEDEAAMRGRYLDRFQDQASLTSDYSDNTEPAGDCLCPKKECSAKADIAFLVDGSANIPQPYYARVLEFIKILSRGLDKSNVHVGLMSYGDDVKVALNLKALDDFQQFDDAVNIAPYVGGKAHTGNALSKLKTGLFAASGRKDAPRALVLLSSGGSVDDVVAPGLELRDSGVKVTAIGLGKQANVRELITVASEPKSEHVFTAFLDTLPNAMDEIIQGICRDVMGIVRDRQEPCTCETHNGQVSPSSGYSKAASNKIPQSVSPQEDDIDSSNSQGQGKMEGARVPFYQSEHLSRQRPASYPYSNEGSPVRGEESTSPEGDGRLSYGPHGGQSNDALKRPTDLQTEYSNEQGSANQGDLSGKLGNQDNYHGQATGGHEERPLNTQKQNTRLPGDQHKVVDEKEDLEEEEDAIGAEDYSTNIGYKSGGQNNHLRNEGAKGLMHSPQSHRFVSGFPEHYKPHISDGDKSGEKLSNQGSSRQQEKGKPSEAQDMDDQGANLLPFISTLNHDRVQGTASNTHPGFILPSGNDSAKDADEFLYSYRRPTKVIAVDKAAENVKTDAQVKYHQACAGINLGVVLDSTTSPRSRGNQRGAKMLDLAKKVSHLFPISPEGNSVGMVVYGGSPQPSVVHFDKFLDQKSMDEAIEDASNPNLEIKIGKALSLAQKHLFSDLAMSGRNVLLLVTDGSSFDDVSRPAVELKRRGIEVFCLGVGQDVNRAQLDLIASEPKENHVFLAPFNDSEILMERLRKEICLAANKSRKEAIVPKKRGSLSHNLAEM